MCFPCHRLLSDRIKAPGIEGGRAVTRCEGWDHCTWKQYKRFKYNDSLQMENKLSALGKTGVRATLKKVYKKVLLLILVNKPTNFYAELPLYPS